MPDLKTSTLLLPILLALLGAPRESWAVRPFHSTIALVAGQESGPGYQDGSFTSALFNRPLGLAVSADGNSLFVADSGNNRIRIIHLDRNNEVTTLAGQDKPGKADGPLAEAQFNDPRGLLALPDDRLLVNDFGNQLLRIVDLKAGTVSTLAGASPAPAPTGTPTPSIPAAQASMKDVRAMAYLPGADAVFYTQPDPGSLKKLDLKSGLVSTVLEGNARLPHPAALWGRNERLYLADNGLPEVFQLDWKDPSSLKPVPLATPVTQVLSLSANGGVLYALLNQPGVPIQRFPLDGLYDKAEYRPHNQAVSFRSPWGDTISPDQYFPSSFQPAFAWMGCVPDPSDSRKFYVARPDFNEVISFQDLLSTGFYNSNGLIGPESPAKKPKNTFRIIFVGDSRSFEIHNYPFKTDFHPQKSPYYPYPLYFSQQMERELNFQAALQGVTTNFEVYNCGHHGELLCWPTFELPPIVKKNDIDLVLIFSPQSDHDPYWYYFDHPLSPDGIPVSPNDMEYLLKDPLDRIPGGLPRKFYDYCKTHGLVKVREGIWISTPVSAGTPTCTT